MKRKLSALLAIVLAVVMVFPTAVFVGAVGEKEANMIVTFDGIINGTTGRPADPVSIKYVDKAVSGEFYLALYDSAEATIELGSNYKNLKLEKVTDNGVAWPDSYDVSDNKFTITTGTNFPKSVMTETFRFSVTRVDMVMNPVTKKEEPKDVSVPDFMTFTVHVLPIEIIDVTLYGMSADSDFHKSEEVLEGNEQYNSKNTLKLTKVDVVYNNTTDKNDVALTDENLEIEVWSEVPGEAGKWLDENDLMMKDGTSFELRGDYKQLKYTYYENYDGKHDLAITRTIDLSVTSSSVVDIDAVVVTEAYNTPLDGPEKITEALFKDRLNISVEYKEIPARVNYDKGHWGTVFTVKYYEDKQYKAEVSFNSIDFANGEDAYFKVFVEDKEYFSNEDSGHDTVKDYFIFKERLPVGIDIDWDNAVKKVYNEGYVIGTDKKDWEGVTAEVTYDNGDVVVYTSVDDLHALNIEISPLVAKQKFVTVVSVDGEPIGTAENLPTGFEILPREVVGITLPQTVLTYTEGEKLDLTGIKATLKYNFGDNAQRAITNDEFTCSPKNGADLKVGDDKVLVVYKDPTTGNEFSGTIPLKVNAKPVEGKSIKEVKLLSSANAKREYFIGEKFDADGFEFLIVYSDATTDVKDLGNYPVTVDSTRYSSSSGFTAAMNGELKVKINISYNNQSYTINMTLPGIVVTKRPVLQSIVADTVKANYMVGDMPEVQQFTITAKYDDNSSRVFQFADDVTDTEKAKSTFTDTVGGVTYTIKVTPNRIDEDTDSIRVSYSEKVTGVSGTITKYDDVEIEVIIPDAIMSYYDGGWKTKAYMDFDDALDAAEDYADSLATSYQQSRKPGLQLCKDITVLYDYSVTEYMEIDLNGFDMTMVPGEIFVKSTSSAEITFTNNGDEASKIIYSKTNDDDNIIIAVRDTYVIDADSGDGKYEVTITKPTNGKVTGPEEVTHGHDAKFTITPNEDYEVKTITVKEGKTTKKYDNKDNIVTVADVQGALTITVTFQEKAWENPFTDVYKSATYYKSIQFVYENGLFSGMSATKFEPDTTMTRAMFVTVLGRLAGIDADEAASRYGKTSTFSDVSATDASISYAVPYIKWATDNGLIEGYGNGKFGPKDNITHIQMYVLMQRYAAFIERLNTNATGANIAANDVKDIPTWDGAYEAVEYAAKNSFLITSSNRLTPNGNAKRSELAMLLEKFCTNVLDWEK